MDLVNIVAWMTKYLFLNVHYWAIFFFSFLFLFYILQDEPTTTAQNIDVRFVLLPEFASQMLKWARRCNVISLMWWCLKKRKKHFQRFNEQHTPNTRTWESSIIFENFFQGFVRCSPDGPFYLDVLLFLVKKRKTLKPIVFLFLLVGISNKVTWMRDDRISYWYYTQHKQRLNAYTYKICS